MEEKKIKKKFYIETFGCQMNEFDSERIDFLLKKEGFIRTDEITDSDIIIINTCSVRKKSENRLYGHIGNLKEIKDKNPGLVICIGGCTAQNLKEKIIKDFPYVDIVFGTGNIDGLPDMIQKKEENTSKNRICRTDENIDLTSDRIYHFNRSFSFKAFLPVMVGCDNYCSYCIVPFVRGKERSIHPDIIINKLIELVEEGLLEVTLLGQNVNSYGFDLEDIGIKYDFSSLLERVAVIKGLKRIRFMTSHPKDLKSTLLTVISKYKNIMNHIHLPVQAGSDKILGLMNRKYTRDDYISIFNSIKEVIPDCSITTDIMVGFPGENREDFEQSLDLVEKLRFNRAFTFLYSKRPGTSAENLNDFISMEEKKIWFKELVGLQNRISLEENKKLIGKEFKALVEKVSKKQKDQYEGRLENNNIINFSSRQNIVGNFIKLKITEAKEFYLNGEMT